MAHRLREAARQLGGGALGGVAPDDDARAPALVVAFRAFGNAETVSPAIAEALEAAGAEVCRVEGAEPDAADLALGANLDAFANAWAADASAPPPPGFLTERVVDALRREAAASSSSRATDADPKTRVASPRMMPSAPPSPPPPSAPLESPRGSRARARRSSPRRGAPSPRSPSSRRTIPTSCRAWSTRASGAASTSSCWATSSRASRTRGEDRGRSARDRSGGVAPSRVTRERTVGRIRASG